MKPQETNPNPKKTAAPAKQYGCLESLGMILIAFFGLGIYLWFTGDSKEKGFAAANDKFAEFSSSNSNESAFTPIGEKAMKLKPAHSRTDVIKRLGQPDWVILPSDNPTDFHWRLEPGSNLMFIYRNPGHAPVKVDFANGYFTGADGGFLAQPDDPKLLPPDQFSAKQPDRKKYADVWFSDDQTGR